MKEIILIILIIFIILIALKYVFKFYPEHFRYLRSPNKKVENYITLKDEIKGISGNRDSEIGDDAIKYLCMNNQTFVFNNRELCSSI